jgi:signal transduction histidine kinase
LLRAQIHSHGISIELEVEDPLPKVRGDIRRFEQLLVNLLSNARDALDTLPADAPRTVRIRARASPEPGLVVIEVADNGPGIAAEVRERIFEPFFTTKDVGKGTGLGLSIVCRIVADCGGRLTVETGPGTGTTFRIELPVAQPAGAEGTERGPDRGGEESSHESDRR